MYIDLFLANSILSLHFSHSLLIPQHFYLECHFNVSCKLINSIRLLILKFTNLSEPCLLFPVRNFIIFHILNNTEQTLKISRKIYTLLFDGTIEF